jgi:hypothetical protein
MIADTGSVEQPKHPLYALTTSELASPSNHPALAMSAG